MSENDFLQDLRAGLSVDELARRHNLTPAKVSARIRWAREHGKLDQTGGAAPPLASGHPSPPDGEREDPASPPDTGADPSAEGTLSPPVAVSPAPRPVKTPEEIHAILGSLKDKSIQHRLHASVQARIRAHEQKIGKKDASFRLAQQDWAQRERLRMLGLTVNDIRRARGILPSERKEAKG